MTEAHNWVGFDLDGTLAECPGEWRGPLEIGAPIPQMIDLLKWHLEAGVRVKIFTARVAQNEQSELGAKIAEEAIREWCKEHIGQELEVTCCKDYGLMWFYDDRAVQVARNDGYILGKDFDIYDYV